MVLYAKRLYYTRTDLRPRKVYVSQRDFDVFLEGSRDARYTGMLMNFSLKSQLAFCTRRK